MTAVAWVKPVPVMVTKVPTAAVVGAKLVIAGVVTVKLPELVPVVLPVELTAILPVVAPLGTTALTDVALV